MKIGFIISGIILSAGVITFFGLHYYEQENNCELHLLTEVPFIKCNRIDWFDTFNNGVMEPKKPLILLYPQKDTKINISLSYIP